MTYRQVYRVTDNTVIITLPAGFKNKQVVITVDDVAADNNDKLSLMRKASKDPMYLSDMKEVNDDFGPIDHETL